MESMNELQIIRVSLWGTEQLAEESIDYYQIYDNLLRHTVAALPAQIFSRLPLQEDLKTRWKKYIYQQVMSYHKILGVQQTILQGFDKEKIPVVVVKGTSAACYYPEPELRTMGDIDLLTSPQYLEQAVSLLLRNGWSERINEATLRQKKHRVFSKQGVTVELHHRFGSDSILADSKGFDELLYQHINQDNHRLPDEINGLVILEHIAKHLNNGIGLRQVIDWTMFVHSYLNDDHWQNRFCPIAQEHGLAQFAIVLTRMCQMYLGLRTEQITWCMDADALVCQNLLEYVMRCGNFGMSREILESGAVTSVPSLKHPIKVFAHIQRRGRDNWKITDERPYLRPFAWVYQIILYLKTITDNQFSLNQLRNVYRVKEHRKSLFSAIGLRIDE